MTHYEIEKTRSLAHDSESNEVDNSIISREKLSEMQIFGSTIFFACSFVGQKKAMDLLIGIIYLFIDNKKCM